MRKPYAQMTEEELNALNQARIKGLQDRIAHYQEHLNRGEQLSDWEEESYVLAQDLLDLLIQTERKREASHERNTTDRTTLCL